MKSLWLFFVALLLPIYDVPAQTPYYQGKTITFIVGSGA